LLGLLKPHPYAAATSEDDRRVHKTPLPPYSVKKKQGSFLALKSCFVGQKRRLEADFTAAASLFTCAALRTRGVYCSLLRQKPVHKSGIITHKNSFLLSRFIPDMRGELVILSHYVLHKPVKHHRVKLIQ
jgi:hypothetical protein